MEEDTLQDPIEPTEPTEQKEDNVGQIIISGDLDATQYDNISEQILSLQDSGVSKILFEVNSSGGEVLGIDSLIQVLRECSIPTETLITGICASSAYWIASQTGRIVANGLNVLVGSIGVFSSMVSTKRYLESMGIQEWTVVSEGSPKKIAQSEEEFIEQEQPVVDEIFENFVTDVANGRGLTVEEVKSNFGEGAVLTAKQAMEVGMIDAIFGEETEEEVAEDLDITSEAIEPQDEEITASKSRKTLLKKQNPKLAEFRRIRSIPQVKVNNKNLTSSWKKDAELVQVGRVRTIKHIPPSFYSQYKKQLLSKQTEERQGIF